MEIRTDLWNGELVTAKTGGDPAALRREADLLKELEHPGLVAFAKLEEGETGPRLLTRYAGRHSLSTWQPRRLEDLLTVFEGLAAALSYLHGKNLFHLNICSDHVLIGMSQSPILCSFAAAKQAETPGESSDLAAKDIADLGLTMLKAIESAPPSLKRRGKRLTERLRLLAVAAAEGRIRSAPNLQGQLRSLTSASKQHCASEKPRSRNAESPRGESLESNKPSVHVIGAETSYPDPSTAKPSLQQGGEFPELNENLPSFGDANSRGSTDGKVIEELEDNPSSFVLPKMFKVRTAGGLDKERLKPRRPLSARRLLRLVCILLGFLALALMTVMLLQEEEEEEENNLAQVSEAVELENAPKSVLALEGQKSQPDKQPEHMENHPNETSDGDFVSQQLQIEGDSIYCRPESPGYLIVDGSGCAERVVVGVGFVSVGGRSYPVGGPSDKLFVGDWNCDGVSTLALAEASGKVYVFDGWPTSEALEPAWADNLPRNGSVEMISEGNCDLLVALDEEGKNSQLEPQLPPD